MITLEPTIQSPLTLTDDGTIRLAGTRVTLDSIVHHFLLGATAEEIAHKFPSASLTNVYGAINYYLTHRAEMDEYLRGRAADATEIRRRIEMSRDTSELRARWLARHSQNQSD